MSTTLLLPFKFVVALPLVSAELHGFTARDWEDLKSRGLGIVDLDPKQVERALQLKAAHGSLSAYDCFSLALAEANDTAILLTGDRQLRLRATSLNVETHGVLWIVDQILRLGNMPQTGLLEALLRWSNDPLVFLPTKELHARIEQIRHELSRS